VTAGALPAALLWRFGMHAEGLWAAGSATTADALDDCTTARLQTTAELFARAQPGGSRSPQATVSLL
jgi:hypothetical protein